MSWFNTSGISSLAKSAISQAQKSIDKVLDIKDENEGVTAGSRSMYAAKSRSYTEASSRSHQQSKFQEEDDYGDDASRTSRLRKDKSNALEEESFFSSFLGSDKHSTPKLKSDTKGKLTSQSITATGNSEVVNQKPNSKNKRSSRSLSSSSTEAASKGNTRYDAPDTSEEEVSNTKLKEHVKKDTKERVDKDSLEGFLDESVAKSYREAKSTGKEDVKKDRQEESNGNFMNNLLSESEPSIGRVSTMETEQTKYENVSMNVDMAEKAVTSNNLTNESRNTILQDQNYCIDNDNDDDNSEYVDASDNIEVDDSSSCQLDCAKQNDVGRGEPPLGSEEKYTQLGIIGDSSREISSAQDTVSDDYENDMKNCEIEHLDENDMDIKESLENQDLTVKEPDIVDGREWNDQSDFNEEYISKESDRSLDVVKEQLSTDIEGGHRKEENGMTESDSVLDSNPNEYHDKVDSPMDGNSDKQLGGPHSNDFRNSVDDVSNDVKTCAIDIVSCAAEQKIKDIEGESQFIGNTDSSTDWTVKPEPIEEDTSMISRETTELHKEIKRLQEVVDVRESRMVALSKENIDLQEAVAILRNQLEQAQQVESGENEVIREMRDEFTNIVDEMRIELKTVKKERDELKIELEDTIKRLTKNSDELIDDYMRSIKEKEDQIAELLVEGEALSKKELKSNNLLKKFRAKVKTLEEKSEQIMKQTEEKDTEISKLKETVKEKSEQEKALKEQVKTLESITDQQEDENSKLKDQLDDAEDKIKGMQTTLDSGYQEINRLNLEKANIESEIEEIKHLKTTKAEFEQRLMEVEDQAKHEKLTHLEELSSLRLCLTRTEQTSARREDSFQMEIKDLQHRLDGAESRNQELSQSIATASRPLLRQIENLQSSHQNQAQNWERIEKNLTERLANAQQQLAHITEKERSAVDFAMEMKSRVSGLELQIKTLREQKDELSRDLEELKESSKIVEEDLNKEKKSLEAYQSSYRKAFEELQNEKIYIEDQLNAERAKHEAELLKILNDQKASGQISRQNSLNAIQSSWIEGKTETGEVEPVAPHSSSRPRTSSSSSSTNLIDSSNKHTSTAVMEKLQTQLRQKDGELRVHQEEIDSLQKTRASLAQELVSLSNLVEELQDKVKGYDSMKKKYQDIESRYNAALQLYGEKVEEADELRMDLDDIKQMYKQQIQQLIGDR